MTYLKFFPGLEGLKKSMTGLNQNSQPIKDRILMDIGSCSETDSDYV
jgi:hypothetical protein